MNKKFAFILVGIVIVLALAWLYSSRESKGEVDRSALEMRLSQITFTAESVLPKNSENEKDSKIFLHRLMRTDINDSTLANSKNYLNSLVIGIIGTDYEKENQRRHIEIAQFASSNDAYGFYSQNRPPGVAFDTVGTESFFADSTFHFVQGNYVISVSTNEEKNQYLTAKNIAKQIEANIPQKSAQPFFFRFFPYREQLVPSQKYYSLDYLGIKMLDEVFAVDYKIDEDTVTLFLTTDTSGEKFLQFSEWAKEFGEIKKAPPVLEFPDLYSLSFEHPEKGEIVAGLVNRKFIGIIGYKRTTGIEIMQKWILGLK